MEFYLESPFPFLYLLRHSLCFLLPLLVLLLSRWALIQLELIFVQGNICGFNLVLLHVDIHIMSADSHAWTKQAFLRIWHSKKTLGRSFLLSPFSVASEMSLLSCLNSAVGWMMVPFIETPLEVNRSNRNTVPCCPKFHQLIQASQRNWRSSSHLL